MLLWSATAAQAHGLMLFGDVQLFFRVTHIIENKPMELNMMLFMRGFFF